MEIGILFNNRILDIIFISWSLAQGIKIITHLILKKRFKVSLLWATGGMPSSHSATVTALATSVGLIKGFSGVEFALAASLASIVMYDAAGIRQAAGKQAEIINQIIEKFYKNTNVPSGSEKKLKELLGHTPIEVFAGAILGIVVAFLMKGYIV